MRRYAVYLAPPIGSPLARFAAGWLGREADTGARVDQPVVAGLDAARLADITASPRHYGFHGTLKAPFTLAAGQSVDALLAALAGLARRTPPFELRLRLGSIAGFLALVPAAPSPLLEALAAWCVCELDEFRAPLSAEDLDRRRKAGLTPQAEAHLVRFGYPYVLDQFRFHMTLTERLEEPERAQVRAVLERMVAPFCAQPMPVAELCLFVQESRAAPFAVRRRVPISGSDGR